MNTGHWSNVIQCRKPKFLSASSSTTNPQRTALYLTAQSDHATLTCTLVTSQCSCGYGCGPQVSSSHFVQLNSTIGRCTTFLTLASGEYEWLAKCYSLFNPDENFSCIHWIGVGWASELVWTLWRREKLSPDSPGVDLSLRWQQPLLRREKRRSIKVWE